MSVVYTDEILLQALLIIGFAIFLAIGGLIALVRYVLNQRYPVRATQCQHNQARAECGECLINGDLVQSR